MRANKKMAHGPVVEADTLIPVANYLGAGLIAYLYVGTPAQKVTIVFDSGSDWTSLETDMCSNCYAPVFKTKNSTTYSNSSTKLYSLRYNNMTLNGYVG